MRGLPVRLRVPPLYRAAVAVPCGAKGNSTAARWASPSECRNAVVAATMA